MRSNILAGIVAGLVAGFVFGMMMQMTMAPTPEGASMPMMAMVGKILHSDSSGVAWIYHLFNSAVIGAIFGWIFGGRVSRYPSGLAWAALYGVFWWVLGGLILMPVLLRMPAFAPLMMAPMRPVAMSSLLGHIVYGLILGCVFVWMSHHRPAALRHA